MQPRVIASAVGAVVSAIGLAMLLPALYALLTGGEVLAFLAPAAGSLLAGGGLFFSTREPNAYVSIRDVFLIVVLGWFGAAFAGALPFVLSGLMGPVDAFFEGMAGFTTTGASTVVTPEEVAPSLLLWRSLMQWTGGIGIVLLFVAVGPLLGFGASQLYSAEMANPIPERLTPRIRETAKVLSIVYLGLTGGGIVALFLAGMSLFDAVNHALTTVSTGGFSTRTDSIAAFDSVGVEVAITAGMLLSGTSFALYFLFWQGRRRRVLGNRELLAFLSLFAAGAVLITGALYAFEGGGSSSPVREAVFQSASLLTGTAFSTADWNGWNPFSQSLLMLFMLIGGCAGSTSGGIKVVRAVLLVRHATQEGVRMVHPRAVTPLRLGSQVIPERMRTTFLSFFFVYALTLAAGTLIMSLHGLSAGEAFGAVFASVNITGAGLGEVGQPGFYRALPATGKTVLAFFMLLGRLELFTVLVLLSPAFWRR